MINAAQELFMVAARVMSRRDLAPVTTRAAILRDLYKAAEAASLEPVPTSPTLADAVALLHVCEGLRAACITARDLGAPSLAHRLDEAARLASSMGDTAQLKTIEVLGLPVDYAAGDVGSRLDSGFATVADLRALDAA